MIQYFYKESGKLQELADHMPGCWINVLPPFNPNELQDLASTIDIPLDFLTDSLDVDERSRYEREEEGNLILLNTPILNEDRKDNEAFYTTVPIGIVLTAEHIITISSVDNPVLRLFKENRVKNFATTDQSRFVLQLFSMRRSCLSSELRLELYNSSSIRLRLRFNFFRQVRKRKTACSKSLVYFVNSLSSNELLKMKMKRTDFLKIREDEDMMDLFEDVIIDNSQALEMANVHTNILNGTMEAYASIISNNLNFVIQRLTFITLILMVPTLIASYYGMNFTKLPLAETRGGFYYVVAISIVISLGLAYAFRRKRLL